MRPVTARPAAVAAGQGRRGARSPRSTSSEETADRLAIRELVDAYAYCADSHDAVAHALFEILNTYTATMHFNGQSTVTLDGDRATGHTYCPAHHV